MANATSFDWVCSELEERSSLDRLEARGTVRIALKQAGLDARSVTRDQMEVVLGKVLPAELEARAVEGAAAICDALRSGVKQLEADGGSESPDAVFSRLGGG
jgi:hypothetical protein